MKSKTQRIIRLRDCFKLFDTLLCEGRDANHSLSVLDGAIFFLKRGFEFFFLNYMSYNKQKIIAFSSLLFFFEILVK